MISYKNISLRVHNQRKRKRNFHEMSNYNVFCIYSRRYGAYHGNPFSKCLVRSNSTEIHIEIHFVLNCTFYNHIRYEYFSEILENIDFNLKTDSEKLIFLVNSKPRTLAKYIVKAYMQRRKNTFK